MQVKEIMTENPRLATPEMDLLQAARLMKLCDCGAIPVVNDETESKPVGLITDRDIVIRSIAEEICPLQLKVKDCMSILPITISPEATLEECARRMEKHRVRRLIVVDADGRCCGIVVQAQLARNTTQEIAAELLREISQSAPFLALSGS